MGLFKRKKGAQFLTKLLSLVVTRCFRNAAFCGRHMKGIMYSMEGIPKGYLLVVSGIEMS